MVLQRQPEKRPPAVVSLAFAGLAFTPLLLLVGLLGAIGVNTKVGYGSVRLKPAP